VFERLSTYSRKPSVEEEYRFQPYTNPVSQAIDSRNKQDEPRWLVLYDDHS